MLTPIAPKLLNPTDDNRGFLRAFIHTYRDLPILWDTSLRDYTNRDKRAEAYETLVPIYRYLKRDATVEDVKKKINTLRTNYRKELKVVECARRTGSVYQPRCWTFHELDFLRNSEKFLAVHPNVKGESTSSSFAFNESSQTATSFMEAPSFNFRSMIGNYNSNNTNIGHQPPPNVSEMFQKSFGVHNNNNNNNNSNINMKLEQHHAHQQQQQQQQQHQQQNAAHNGTPPPASPATVSAHAALPTVQAEYATHTQQQQQQQQHQQHQQSTTPTPGTAHHDVSNAAKRQRIMSITAATSAAAANNQNSHHHLHHSTDELLGIACDYLSSTFPEEESIVRTWTHKLKRMQREQRLLAEKFINEIIFEGELNTLHRGSVQINAFEPYVRFEEQANEEQPHQKSQSPSVNTSTTTAANVANNETTDTKEVTIHETTVGGAASGAAVASGNDANFDSYNQ